MVLCIKLKDSLKIKPHPFLVEDAPEKIVAWPGDTAGILFGSVYIGTLLYCSSGYITTHRPNQCPSSHDGNSLDKRTYLMQIDIERRRRNEIMNLSH